MTIVLQCTQTAWYLLCSLPYITAIFIGGYHQKYNHQNHVK